jgi:hypothetical protein
LKNQKICPLHIFCGHQSAQLKAKMRVCSYTLAKCKSECLHITKNGVVSKYCTYHVMKVSSRKKTKAIVSFVESIEKTEKSRLRMKLHREKQKQVLEDIVDPEVQRIAVGMAKLRKKQRDFVIINSVIQTLDPESIELTGSAEPIDFTDSKAPVLRTMQEIEKSSEHLFANVINALKIVSPVCTLLKLKVIKSLANDTPQLTHTDLNVSLINKKV